MSSVRVAEQAWTSLCRCALGFGSMRECVRVCRSELECVRLCRRVLVVSAIVQKCAGVRVNGDESSLG